MSKHCNVGKNNPNHKHGRYIRKHFKCIECGGKISKNPNAERCWTCWIKWLQIPENNNNWHGGLSFEDYSFSWNEELKESIRKRDNYTCQLCHKKGKDVHHVDYDKNNCNKENLITLCIGCNSKANYNRDYWYAYFNYLISNKEEVNGQCLYSEQ